MLDVVAWLLAVELLGLVAFPIVYALTPWLPDRGYTLAKPIGLLLAFYPLWLLASSRVVPNGLFTLLFVLVVLASVSLWVVWRRQDEMQEFLCQEWRMLLLAEVVFLGVFAMWVVIRAYDPAISHTEQPMDFAFLNSSVVSRHFPPQDPWLAGETVSYYYFGYLIFGGLTRLAGVSTAVGYNLALALVAALAAAGVFGLGTNVVRLAGGALRGAVLSGLVALFLLLGVANLESGLEFVRASGNGSPEFWEWVDIKGLDGPSESSTWYPSEAGWWWWRATRVIDTVENGRSLDYTITEFPFFSFFLGDLHPHVMSLPFVLAFAGLVLNFFVAPTRLGLWWLKSGGMEVLALALALGALGFISLWDLPVFGALLAAAALAKGYGQERAIVRGSLVALPTVVPVVALAVLLYLPFYFTFDSQAQGVLPVDEYVTRAFHFVVVWGLFLVIAVPFALWNLVSALRRGPWRWQEGATAAALALAPWLAWWLMEIGIQGARVLASNEALPTWLEVLLLGKVAAKGPLELIAMAWRRLLHLLPLMLLLAAVVYTVLRQVWRGAKTNGLSDAGSAEGNAERAAPDVQPVAARGDAADGDSGALPEVAAMAGSSRLARAFPLVLLAMALLLLMGPELFHVLDIFGNRMNTVFKLSYQAWTLLAVACSYALYYLGSRYGRSGPWMRVAGYGWIGLLVIVVVAAVYYPAAAVYSQTSGPGRERTLDGLVHVAKSSLGELRGIQWLKKHYQPGDVIIEAVGDDYSDYGRVSASTGIPTVLGWMGHEEQWRGSRKPFQGREEAVRQLYQTREPQEAKEILRRYGVTYIFVGPRERAKYGIEGFEKFTSLGDVVFQEGDVVIYRVRE